MKILFHKQIFGRWFQAKWSDDGWTVTNQKGEERKEYIAINKVTERPGKEGGRLQATEVTIFNLTLVWERKGFQK